MGLTLPLPASAAVRDDRVESGGKAAGLMRLERAGTPVPPWFAIPTSALDAHLGALGLNDEIDRWLRALSALDAASAQWQTGALALHTLVRERLHDVPIPADLRARVAASLRELEPGPFAVRSSMAGEDGQARSWAGVLESQLWRRDLDEVLDAVVDVWSSAFAPRVLAYARRNGAVPRPRMAVVVQRMVVGRASGVAFSADPVTSRGDVVRIAACFGLGEGVVGGQADADEYVVDGDGCEVESAVAAKLTMIVPRYDGPGTIAVPLPLSDRQQRVLSPADAARVAVEARRLERLHGVPLDIEWTIDDRTLWILQARPITAVAVAATPAAAAAEPVVVWDNSNIQESYCGVTTPLTFSFARAAYASVYRQTMRVLGLPRRTIERHDELLTNLLGLIRGRVYYNINNWYRGLLLLPAFRRNKADMERMMGLDEPVEFVEDERISPIERLRRIPRLALTGARLAWRLVRLSHDVSTFMARFDRELNAVDRARLAEASIDELQDTADRIWVRLIDRWDAPILNDFFVMMKTGGLRRLVSRAVIDDVDALMPDLLESGEPIESAEPARRLLRIAHLVRGQPRLRGLIAAVANGQLDAFAGLEAIRAESPDTGLALDDYLARYGDRCMGELKLETITAREDPRFVFRVLVTYVDRPDLNVDRLELRGGERRRVAEAAVLEKLGPIDRFRFHRALSAARRGIRGRERMRLARTRLFGVFRQIYLEIGDRLQRRGILASKRDVFWLTVPELRDLACGAAAGQRRALVEQRRAEFAGYERDDPPNRVLTRGGAIIGDSAPAPVADANLLKGIGCCAGIVEAPARVIMRPDDELDLTGHILVTLRTDPGWGPLFLTAAGIIVERGSTLSHSAVLARELGIPAVVGVPGLLARVRDGDRVRIDGRAGTIHRRPS